MRFLQLALSALVVSGGLGRALPVDSAANDNAFVERESTVEPFMSMFIHPRLSTAGIIAEDTNLEDSVLQPHTPSASESSESVDIASPAVAFVRVVQAVARNAAGLLITTPEPFPQETIRSGEMKAMLKTTSVPKTTSKPKTISTPKTASTPKTSSTPKTTTTKKGTTASTTTIKKNANAHKTFT